MNREILQAIAADLRMQKFACESDVQFTNRLLYSALACWIKAASLDHPITDSSDTYSGVSRKHILAKCSRFLEEMLKRNERCRVWFYPEADEESPVHLIRTRLLQHMELLNCGFNTNVTLAGESCEYLGNGVECLKGIISHPNSMYSGVATIRFVNPPKDQKTSLPYTDTLDWFDTFLKSIWWEKYDGPADDWQYFNAYRRVKNNHLCWQHETSNSVGDILFVRRPIQSGMNEYLLINTKAKRQHRFDPYLQKLGEHRRIMIALRAQAGNKLPARALRYADHVHLALRFHLPDQLCHYLEVFAWPHNRVSDKLEWDMPTVIWEVLRPMFTGIELTEEEHG